MTDTTPQLDDAAFRPIDRAKLLEPAPSSHPPRILLLYGSLRQRSFSRLLTEEAARILAVPERIGVDAGVLQRTLDGRLKISPDGSFRESPRYLLVGREGAVGGRPTPR